MSPKRKTEHPVEVHPEYVEELRRRIETGPGLAAVARAADMDRVTLWRALHGGAGHRTTVDTIERARAGLAYLQDDDVPLPPPVISVRSEAHHAWIRLGEALLAEEPDAVAAVLANPDELRRLIRAFAAKRR